MEEDFRMFKYHQYCPVARACEVIADRWTPLIVRELLFGSRHFNELERGLPRISRSLLVPDATARPGRVAPDPVCICVATDAVGRQRTAFHPPERRSVFT